MKIYKIGRLTSPFVLFFWLLIPWRLYGQETSEQEKYHVDSTLFVYYQHCKAEIKSPSVMQMLDTLFLMAKEKGDIRMQAVAISSKTDHFYFSPFFEGQEDSLILYTNMIKDFARKTNQPQYYYFAWGNRLITYYTRQKKLNLALYEANKMQQESESRKEIDGMQNCYQALLRIYQSKELYKQATVYAQKLIDLTLKYNLNKYNLTNKYLELSNCYLRTNEPKKAWEALEESKLYIGNELNQGAYLCGLLRYYIHTKDMVKARETLKETTQLFNKNTELRIKRATNLLEIETNYYIETGEYDKALDVFQQAFEKLSQSGFITPTLYRTRGSIYTAKKDYQKAIESYEKAFELSDSLNSAQEDIAVGEFATILGMEHLNLENKELIQKNQEIQLETRWRIIILLCIIVVIVGIMFFRETRLNKVLRRAKDAEQSASRMKTEFIQNMSHEIRTPLNSIVGFSQILSSKISEEDEESKEYTTIIEQGSNHLLQLVDDVLELSSLDSGTTIPIDTKSELNELCLQWMERAKGLVKPGVVLSYQPEQSELYLHTNPTRLGQVVLHLLHNAARFTEEGSIALSWRILSKQKQIMICITDTGIGIPQDKQDFVFERFAKLDTFSKGTGLGLALSRLIAKKMGGSLTIDSTYTTGSRFILILPLKE
ncbi:MULTISPECIES: HAMP domain-containing sensor histidine kinase [Bacteroides]|jgi:signal transduction histidine kinase|uniref:tetratricopeptide repeat-containing sensor histidine kinase n=1 Tax=Bacteroides TaxID=816 RepID=UPI000E516E63|nr:MULTISPECIES: HAMP domain-containing sensor histidine kinase [Bacteroides]RHL12771.1 hypothetical protein DW036_01525 [Bacteroides sp. AF39-11AC]